MTCLTWTSNLVTCSSKVEDVFIILFVVDLSFDNIGSSSPILKVADFGFAQHLEENKKERGLKGSPLYMAPEIFLSDQYDAKADLWSIGVILYEAVFGKAPFSSDTLEQLVVKIKEDVPVSIPSTRNIRYQL